MLNCNYCYSVPMKPNMEKASLFVEGEFSPEIPVVFCSGFTDVYDEPIFNWVNDSIVVKRGNKIVEYSDSTYYDVLFENENEESSWIDGRVSNITGVDADKVVDVRERKEYKVVEYDLEKSLKRKYKVILEETSDMSEYDCGVFAHYFIEENNGKHTAFDECGVID